MYFRADNTFDPSLVRVFLSRLRGIESWFDSQSSYCFIASSLLFVYDGDAVRLPSDNIKEVDASSPSHPCPSSADNGSSNIFGDELANGSCDASDSWWEDRAVLKMIDFTHAFPVSSPDENYLTGLRSLIRYISLLNPGVYNPDQ